MPRPSIVVDFPRKDLAGNTVGQLAMRVLTQGEQLAATAEAEKFAREHLKAARKGDQGYETFYTDAVCTEILYRACRDVADQSRPAFPTPKHVRDLSTQECTALFRKYRLAQLELGPDLALTYRDEDELEDDEDSDEEPTIQ